jgi:hypothetical protein
MSAQPIEPSTPDHRAAVADLDSAAFREGVARGRWRVVSFEWPHLLVAVAAAERPGSVAEVALRINLQGYPQQAPSSTPWDLATAQQLAPERRPRGEFAGHVFRSDWQNGSALYAPYDRVAIPGHEAWSNQHPADLWTTRRSITFLLDRVYQLLNDDAYEGCA